jgi:hypothetical protein
LVQLADSNDSWLLRIRCERQKAIVSDGRELDPPHGTSVGMAGGVWPNGATCTSAAPHLYAIAYS